METTTQTKNYQEHKTFAAWIKAVYGYEAEAMDLRCATDGTKMPFIKMTYRSYAERMDQEYGHEGYNFTYTKD